jgi:hypothetical protein
MAWWHCFCLPRGILYCSHVCTLGCQLPRMCAQSLQTLGHVAVAADKALVEMRRSIEGCVASARTAQAQHEVRLTISGHNGFGEQDTCPSQSFWKCLCSYAYMA